MAGCHSGPSFQIQRFGQLEKQDQAIFSPAGGMYMEIGRSNKGHELIEVRYSRLGSI
jgi:hypothetical protein